MEMAKIKALFAKNKLPRFADSNALIADQLMWWNCHSDIM